MSDCYIAALRILNYRFNSEAELRRKLRSKKFDNETIDATIEKLRAEKWLDDARFAGAFARTRASKKLGHHRILRELHAAGVDRETATEAVAGALDADREREQILAIVQRRAALLSDPAGRKKLAAYLFKQGYDAALIGEVLRVDHQSDS